MRKSGWRLAVSALLFAAWIGYLAYLAATTTQPTVLSRTQFLTADLFVVADIVADPAENGRPAQEVTVKKVAWSANPDDAKLLKLTVSNLTDVTFERGWTGPGTYILALSRKGDVPAYELTSLPRTPGFAGSPGRIYKVTDSTLRQLELLTNEYHP